MSGTLSAGAGVALSAMIASDQEATPGASSADSSFATESGQALYTLPRDHRWHGGPFSETQEDWEWHCWTALVSNVETGEE